MALSTCQFNFFFFLMKNKNRRGRLASWPVTLPRASSGYVCWRSEFSLGFTLAVTHSDNLCRRTRWSSTENGKCQWEPYWSREGCFQLQETWNLFFWIFAGPSEGTESQHSWKVNATGKDLSGQLSYGHLFRDSLTISSYLLSTHCISAPVLSALGILTHLIPISALWREYFHYLHFTVESWTQRSRHFPEVPWYGEAQWGPSQAFWLPRWIATNSSCFLTWKRLAVDNFKPLWGFTLLLL